MRMSSFSSKVYKVNNVVNDKMVRKSLFLMVLFFSFMFVSAGDVIFRDGDFFSFGDIGIGTSSPDAKLQVVGGNILLDNDKALKGLDTGATARTLIKKDTNDHTAIATANNQDIHFKAGTTEIVRIDGTNDRVGIGTNSPEEKLHVVGNTQISKGLGAGSQELGYLNFRETNIGRDLGRIEVWSGDGGRDSGDMFFRTYVNNGALTTHMTIKDSGNVGIGTDSPTVLLDVNGDVNVSTLYYDTLQAKSPTFLCSEDWCSVSFPKYQKTLWLQKNNVWEISDIVYEDVSYTRQEFDNQICSINQKTQEICVRLNNKIGKLKDKVIADMILKQERESCDYSWDGECFEIVKIGSDYISSVFSKLVNITYQEKYLCQKLNEQLVVIEVNCTRDVVSGTRQVWSFNEGCGWDVDNGYWCEERVLR